MDPTDVAHLIHPVDPPHQLDEDVYWPMRVGSLLDHHQAAALAVSATPSKKVTLIQGPPGTAKSRTLSVAVQAFVTNLINHDTDLPVLVTAPSDYAVDVALSFVKVQPWAQDKRLLRKRLPRKQRQKDRPLLGHWTST